MSHLWIYFYFFQDENKLCFVVYCGFLITIEKNNKQKQDKVVICLIKLLIFFNSAIKLLNLSKINPNYEYQGSTGI